MALPKNNPYQNVQHEFKVETGLDAKDNVATYLAYLQYRLQLDTVNHLNHLNANIGALVHESVTAREGIYKIWEKVKNR